MNVNNITDSLNNHISDNIKPINNNKIEEDSLHAKHKLRQIRDKTTDKFVETLFRYNFMQNIVFNQPKTIKRNLFLLFIYDYFSLHLIADFNKYLMTNNCIILNNLTEYIHFIFKGGNILFIYIINLIEQHDLLANISQPHQTNLNNLFDEYFKVSDFDFGIYLKMDNHEKFIIIKRYLIKFLINILEEINLFFNSYLLEALNVKVSNNLKQINHTIQNGSYIFNYINNNPPHAGIPIQMPLEQLDTFEANLTQRENINIVILNNIDDILSNIYNNIYFDKFLVVVKVTNNLQDILRGQFNLNFLISFTELVSTFEKLKIKDIIYNFIVNIRLINRLLIQFRSNNQISNNKIYISTVIKIISMLNFINNKYNLKIFIHQINLDFFNNKKNNYFKSLKKIISQNNFYSDQVFAEIITNLRTAINDLNIDSRGIFVEKLFYDDPKNDFLFKSKADYTNNTNYTCYKLRNRDSDISIDQFYIKGRDNIAFIKSINENNLYINNLPNNFHYISFNSSINMSDNFNNCNIKFDLLRTKFNISLDNIFVKKYLRDTWTRREINIPSEFIDISIVDFEDTTNLHYNHGNNKIKLTTTIPLINPINNVFHIDTYNLAYIIEDLNNMLWNQYMYPWIDPKYNKRIGRLLFLFVIQDSRPNFRIIAVIHALINNIHIYMNAQTVPNLNNILQLCKFNNNGTYINDFFNKLNELDNNAEQYLQYIYYNDTLLNLGKLDKMFNKIIFLFLLYQLNTVRSGDAFIILNNFRRLFNYYDYTQAQYNTFIQNIVGFINDLKVLLETKIIPNISIILVNLNLIVI